MTRFLRSVFRKNAVFVLGFGLPLFLFGSTSFRLASIIGSAVVIVLGITHGISYFVEPRLPKSLRYAALLLIGAAVLSLYEIALRFFVPMPGLRTEIYLRLLVVDCLVLWPYARSPRGETFQKRMEHVFGLSIGFVVALAFFTAFRFVLGYSGWNLAGSAAIGFFVLGYGKAIRNHVRSRS